MGKIKWFGGWLIAWVVAWVVDWVVDWVIDWVIGWLLGWCSGDRCTPYEGCVDMARCHILLRVADGI